MNHKLEDRVINIVLKEFKSKGYANSILYIDFMPFIKHDGIEISANELSRILKVAEAQELIIIDDSIEGRYVSADKRGINIMSESTDYLLYLKKETWKNNVLFRDNYANLKFIIGIIAGFVSGLVVAYLTHKT